MRPGLTIPVLYVHVTCIVGRRRLKKKSYLVMHYKILNNRLILVIKALIDFKKYILKCLREKCIVKFIQLKPFGKLYKITSMNSWCYLRELNAATQVIKMTVAAHQASV